MSVLIIIVKPHKPFIAFMLREPTTAPDSEHNVVASNTDSTVTAEQANISSDVTDKAKNAFMRFWTSITVEPVIVSFVVGLYLMALTDQNMYLEKACLVNQNYSTDVCAQLMRRESEGIET